MKITELIAHDVHGYLKLRANFNADLTFLTGVNGSGKTTALKLLVSLLTPVPEAFAATSFASAEVSAVQDDVKVKISAARTSDGVDLKINTIEEALSLTSSDLQLMIEQRRREDHRSSREDVFSPVYEKLVRHPVYCAIQKISTPMFLGIDRRFSGAGILGESSVDFRRREYISRRLLTDDEMMRGPSIHAGLVDVNYLVMERMQEIRAAQEKLDEDLRRKFFTRAFEYKPSQIGQGSKFPSREELGRYRQSLITIERVAEGLRLPAPELKATLSNFLEQMTSIVDVLESAAQKAQETASKEKNAEKRKRKMENEVMKLTEDNQGNLLDWIVNKPQSDRILEHLELIDKYVSSRKELHKSIDKFVGLVNSFLVQSKKRLVVADSGDLQIKIDGHKESRSITALSSGERQLLIMLGHLSLNPSLEKSAVFIVDEPELSLHVSWQERFVDAVIEANPGVQYIMATHSPAIILDRVSSCTALGE